MGCQRCGQGRVQCEALKAGLAAGAGTLQIFSILPETKSSYETRASPLKWTRFVHSCVPGTCRAGPSDAVAPRLGPGARRATCDLILLRDCDLVPRR